jgi:hypothetical protein
MTQRLDVLLHYRILIECGIRDQLLHARNIALHVLKRIVAGGAQVAKTHVLAYGGFITRANRHLLHELLVNALQAHAELAHAVNHRIDEDARGNTGVRTLGMLSPERRRQEHR